MMTSAWFNLNSNLFFKYAQRSFKLLFPSFAGKNWIISFNADWIILSFGLLICDLPTNNSISLMLTKINMISQLIHICHYEICKKYIIWNILQNIALWYMQEFSQQDCEHIFFFKEHIIILLLITMLICSISMKKIVNREYLQAHH